MKSTCTMRFAMLAPEDATTTALAACPGSPQHIARSRETRRRNRERRQHDVIPASGTENDIDEWESQGIDWQVIPDSVQVFSGTHVEVHVTAPLTSAQATWLADHLLLDESDADPGTGGTCWTVDGGSWSDERGATPFRSVLIDLH